ncbi:MAG: periplasmic heavy metal sensor [Limisphaerales bacterium]
MKKTLPILLTLCAVGLLFPAAAQPADRPAERGEFRELRERLRNLPPEQREEMLREMRERFREMPPEQRQERLRQFRDQAGRSEGGPGQLPPPGGGPRPMLNRGAGLERAMMVLTPEQRESLRTKGAEQRERVQALEARLANARKDALAVSLDRNFQEPALREKLEAVSKLEVELAVLRARTLAQVEPPLSPEQIERIMNPPPVGEALRERMGRGPGAGPVPPGAPGERPPRRGQDGPRDEHGLPPRAR